MPQSLSAQGVEARVEHLMKERGPDGAMRLKSLRLKSLTL